MVVVDSHVSYQNLFVEKFIYTHSRIFYHNCGIFYIYFFETTDVRL